MSSFSDHDQKRRGKDEMNLAVLPIARLGATDKRTKIEYYGTFMDGGKQKKMVWIVDGGSSGLPTEFAERVLIALLHIGAKQGFKRRKQKFTTYEVLKTLGVAISNRNYRIVEEALDRLVAITVYSDQAWKDQKTKKRVTTKRRFHIIDEAYFHYEDDAEKESYIVWGQRVWSSIQSGYLKYLDLDFYYGLKLPLTRRLYRFLDKSMAYSDEYQIDIFALANKLGMVIYEYPSHLKRALKKAADELVAREWLAEYEFIKVGKFHRIKFYKNVRSDVQLPLFESETTNVLIQKSEWDEILEKLQGSPVHGHLINTKMVGFENGTLTISAGPQAQWMQTL